MLHRVETIEYTDTEVRCYTYVISQILVTFSDNDYNAATPDWMVLTSVI